MVFYNSILSVLVLLPLCWFNGGLAAVRSDIAVYRPAFLVAANASAALVRHLLFLPLVSFDDDRDGLLPGRLPEQSAARCPGLGRLQDAGHAPKPGIRRNRPGRGIDEGGFQQA